MTEDGMSYLQAILALSIVLGMVVALGWLLRRYGAGMSAMPLPGRKKRLNVAEVAVLDPRHRAVLLTRDGTEHLLVLGPQGAQVVETDIAAVSSVSQEARS